MQKFLIEKLDKIKGIIFDFDMTLYSSKNSKNEYLNYLKNAIIKLGKFKSACAEKIIKFYKFDTLERPSFNSVCGDFGITKKQWNEYRFDNFFETDYKNTKAINSSLLKKLKQNFKLFIASNEIKKNIVLKSKNLKIDLDIFDEIIAPENYENNAISKKEIYLYISSKYNIPLKNLLVIGDRLSVDIEPAILLNSNALLVSGPCEIENFFGVFNE